MRKILTGLMLCFMLSLCFGICNIAFAADDIGIYANCMGTEMPVTDGSYVKGGLYAKVKGNPIDFKSIGIRTYKTSGAIPEYVNVNLSKNQSGGYIQKNLFDFEPEEGTYTSK